MEIEKILKEYKIKKSIVETTMARIEQYKQAIINPEIWIHWTIPEGRELGMPGPPLRNTTSPIERIITIKELTTDMLKQWIREDESRIFMYRLEIEQIEKSLDSLTAQEKYLIEMKYFDNMFWKDIELNFNDKLRQSNYITQGRLKQICKEATDKLKIVLEPFYNQFRVA